MNLKTLSLQSTSICQEVARYIKDQLGQVTDQDIETKEYNSLVSYVDKTAEGMLVESLSNLFPEAGFITEEGMVEQNKDKEFFWIIDPLDGTTNFLMGIPHFSVSVALSDSKGYLLGIVIEANSGETFVAYKGGGATLNGKQIRVGSESFSNTLIATGFPYTNDYPIHSHFEALKSVLLETRGMRRMGSAALDLAYVACGRYGAYYESYLNPWDIAAGALIVIEAGGIISDYNSGNTYHDGHNILACAPQHQNRMLEIVAGLIEQTEK